VISYNLAETFAKQGFQTTFQTDSYTKTRRFYDMEPLTDILNLLSEEWKKLSSVYKLWSLLCTLLEFLIISLLQDEIIANLKQFSNESYIWFYLFILIFIIPAGTYLMAWLVCNTRMSNPKSKSQNMEINNVHVFDDKNPHDGMKDTSLTILPSTNHSFIEKKILHDKPYIIKKTNRDFCDVSALKKLVQQEIQTFSGSTRLRVATPSDIWLEDEYVAELIPYYEGITLSKLIKSNKCLVSWDLLGQICNCLIEAINQLHQINIIHRDIVPSNILIDDNGNLTLIDCSFCCQSDTKQVPVFNREFSAPELKSGNAVFSSDWYSMATTIYFLANGFPPPWHDVEVLNKGFRKINTGSYRKSQDFFKDLTQQDIASRPSKLRRLDADTAVPREIILGVFQVEKKYLVNYYHGHVFISQNEASSLLTTALHQNRIEPDNQEFRDILVSIIKKRNASTLS